MMHVGLDLSRRRVDVCVLDQGGRRVLETACSPDPGGLDGLVVRVAGLVEAARLLGFDDDQAGVQAVIESMTGARTVRDHLVGSGWQVLIADAARAKALAPLTCKTDRIDAWVLAELSRRDLVPAIWLPGPGTRGLRERTRFRAHLIKHRTALKNRIHSALVAFGHPCPVSDLFGVGGRRLLATLDLPGPWREDVSTALDVIDHLDEQIDLVEAQLRAHLHATKTAASSPASSPVSNPASNPGGVGGGLDWDDGQDAQDVARFVGMIRRLQTMPGVGPVLALTIAVEIGDISRFPGPSHLVGYTGLCPQVYQSGQRDRRGKLTKHGPKYLRWALIEATTNACTHPVYRDRYRRTKARLGQQRGSQVARVELARRLAKAIWWMLTTDTDFNPTAPTSARAGAHGDLAA
jgi:transposase